MGRFKKCWNRLMPCIAVQKKKQLAIENGSTSDISKPVDATKSQKDLENVALVETYDEKSPETYKSEDKYMDTISETFPEPVRTSFNATDDVYESNGYGTDHLPSHYQPPESVPYSTRDSQIYIQAAEYSHELPSTTDGDYQPDNLEQTVVVGSPSNQLRRKEFLKADWSDESDVSVKHQVISTIKPMITEEKPLVVIVEKDKLDLEKAARVMEKNKVEGTVMTAPKQQWLLLKKHIPALKVQKKGDVKWAILHEKDIPRRESLDDSPSLPIDKSEATLEADIPSEPADTIAEHIPDVRTSSEDIYSPQHESKLETYDYDNTEYEIRMKDIEIEAMPPHKILDRETLESPTEKRTDEWSVPEDASKDISETLDERAQLEDFTLELQVQAPSNREALVTPVGLSQPRREYSMETEEGLLAVPVHTHHRESLTTPTQIKPMVHELDVIHSELDAEIHGRESLETPMPRNEFSEEEQKPETSIISEPVIVNPESLDMPVISVEEATKDSYHEPSMTHGEIVQKEIEHIPERETLESPTETMENTIPIRAQLHEQEETAYQDSAHIEFELSEKSFGITITEDRETLETPNVLLDHTNLPVSPIDKEFTQEFYEHISNIPALEQESFENPFEQHADREQLKLDDDYRRDYSSYVKRDSLDSPLEHMQNQYKEYEETFNSYYNEDIPYTDRYTEDSNRETLRTTGSPVYNTAHDAEDNKVDGTDESPKLESLETPPEIPYNDHVPISDDTYNESKEYGCIQEPYDSFPPHTSLPGSPLPNVTFSHEELNISDKHIEDNSYTEHYERHNDYTSSYDSYHHSSYEHYEYHGDDYPFSDIPKCPTPYISSSIDKREFYNQPSDYNAIEEDMNHHIDYSNEDMADQGPHNERDSFYAGDVFQESEYFPIANDVEEDRSPTLSEEMIIHHDSEAEEQGAWYSFDPNRNVSNEYISQRNLLPGHGYTHYRPVEISCV